MADERRSARRARIPRARVIYESATGDEVEAVALNIGRGGLFIRTANPLAVGKRLSLEMQVAGELAPWSALGRVVWVRVHDEGAGRPAGMGVKLIDVEDSVCDAIDRLVARHGEAAPEVGDPSALGREQTARGITPPQPAPVAPIVSVTPSRERTMLGVGLVGASVPEVTRARVEAEAAALEFARAPVEVDDPLAEARHEEAHHDEAPHDVPAEREHSIAIDLVGKREVRQSNPPVADEPPTWRHEPPTHEQAVDASEPPAVERPRRGRWLVVALVLAAAGGAAYVLLDGDLDRYLRPSLPAAPPRPASPSTLQAPTLAPPPSLPTASPSQNAAVVPSAAASPTASASGTPAPIPSAGASTSAAGTAPRKAPAMPGASAWRVGPVVPPAPRKPPSAADNPY